MKGEERKKIKRMIRCVFVFVLQVAVKKRCPDKPSFGKSERIGIARASAWKEEEGEFNFDDVCPQNERNGGLRE